MFGTVVVGLITVGFFEAWESSGIPECGDSMIMVSSSLFIQAVNTVEAESIQAITVAGNIYFFILYILYIISTLV
jgi:hypothetical protein